MPTAVRDHRDERPGFWELVGRLSAAQKTTVGIPAYSRWVNRPVGRLITAAAFRSGRTPNQVTAVSALWSLAAIVLLAVLGPAWWVGPLVAGLLVVGYAFDSADGQLARLRGGGSAAGEWLDHVVDIAKICALHLAVGLYLLRAGSVPDAVALVALGYCVLAVVAFFGWLLCEQLVEVHRLRSGAPKPPPPAPAPGARALLKLPLDYGVLCLTFLLVGVPEVFALVYGALFAAYLVYTPLALRQWFRRLTALG